MTNPIDPKEVKLPHQAVLRLNLLADLLVAREAILIAKSSNKSND